MNNWQRNPEWINTKLGTSNTTIGDYGCTISVIGNILGVDPVVVNDRMKAVSGFSNGNLVIWAKIEEAFPGIKIRRVWSYDNADVLANVPHVIVEVPGAPIGGTGSHWVQFLGNKRLNDPWTGKERPTSDFPNPTGYCVITGTWTVPEQMANVTQKEYDETRLRRDELYNLHHPFEVAGYLTIDDVNRKIGELNATITNITKDNQTLTQRCTDALSLAQKTNEEDLKAHEDVLVAQKRLNSVNSLLGLDTNAPQEITEEKIKNLMKPVEEIAKQTIPVMTELYDNLSKGKKKPPTLLEQFSAFFPKILDSIAAYIKKEISKK